MSISSLPPSQTSPSNVTNIRIKKHNPALNASTTQANDSVQFAGNTKKVAFRGDAPPSHTTGERFNGAWKAVKNNVTTLGWWGKQTAIAGAITLATCWLPGSQLFTIPLWLGIDLTLKAIDGFSNPEQQNVKKQANDPQSEQSSKASKSDKAKGALKGIASGAWHGVKDDFGKKALISGALCLATCWLPGSQLFLIPAVFSTYAAWGGVQRGMDGWKRPELFLDHLKKPGETQAK